MVLRNTTQNLSQNSRDLNPWSARYPTPPPRCNVRGQPQAVKETVQASAGLRTCASGLTVRCQMSLKAAHGEPPWAPILGPHFINIHSHQVDRRTDCCPETSSRTLQFISTQFSGLSHKVAIWAYNDTCIHLALVYLLSSYSVVFPPIRHHRHGQVDVLFVLYSGNTWYKFRLQHSPFCLRLTVIDLSLSRQMMGQCPEN